MRIFKAFSMMFMAALAVAYWYGTRPTQQVDFSEPLEQEAVKDPHDFALKDLKGKPVRLSDFKGKPILLNFWASWCPPCIEEFPDLLKFSEWAAKSLGVVVLAVSVDEQEGAVEKLFREKKLWSLDHLPLTILRNPDQSAAQQYGSSKYPETFFIDKSFKVARKFVGIQKWTSQEIVQWVTEHSK